MSESVIGRLAGANGYQLSVTRFRGRVAISAVNGRAGATYVARGTGAPDHLAADFGEFGSVDMTFQPSGPPRHRHIPDVPEGCRATLTVQPGVLRGTFAFEARENETGATASQIQAKRVRSKFVCSAEPTTGGEGHGHSVHGRPAVFLEASNSLGQYGTSFEAMRVGDRRYVQFIADTSERVGSVQVFSSVSTRGPASAFAYNVRKGVATVTPPAPFSGTAQLGSENGVPSWTGDLSVDLPGYGSVALTGPPFQASLGHGDVAFIGTGYGRWYRPLAAPSSALFTGR